MMGRAAPLSQESIESNFAEINKLMQAEGVTKQNRDYTKPERLFTAGFFNNKRYKCGKHCIAKFY